MTVMSSDFHSVYRAGLLIIVDAIAAPCLGGEEYIALMINSRLLSTAFASVGDDVNTCKAPHRSNLI